MRRNVYIITIIFLITIIAIFCIKTSKKYVNTLEEIKQENISLTLSMLYHDTIDDIVDLLKVNKASDSNGPLKLIRLGSPHDGGYVVSEVALQRAEVLMGYGVATDISFESAFSDLYRKPSYGFDCTIKNIKISNPLVHFIPECLGSNSFFKHSADLLFVPFEQQIKKLGLDKKNIFLKIDIEGSELDALPELLPYLDNITGIAMELHIEWSNIVRVKYFLEALNKKFVLINVHANFLDNRGIFSKKVSGKLLQTMQLSYVNRNLIETAEKVRYQVHPGEYDKSDRRSGKEHKYLIMDDDYIKDAYGIVK